MKTRKTVSYKKAAHKTRRGRSRSRSRSRSRAKRGGTMTKEMMMNMLRLRMYHNILPLLNTKPIIYETGVDPNPNEYNITESNKRYYRSITDIPAENPITTSIRNLLQELVHPVKTFDKLKSLKTNYDEVMMKLQTEEKRKQGRIEMVQGRSLPVSTPVTDTVVKPTISDSGTSPQSNYKELISKYINKPFSSPRTQISSSSSTPQKLKSKSELPERIRNGDGDEDEGDEDDDDGDGDEDGYGYGGVARQLFFTPLSSPQHQPNPKPQNHQNNQSKRTLSFDNATSNIINL